MYLLLCLHLRLSPVAVGSSACSILGHQGAWRLGQCSTKLGGPDRSPAPGWERWAGSCQSPCGLALSSFAGMWNNLHRRVSQFLSCITWDRRCWSPGVRVTPFPPLLAKHLFGAYWVLNLGTQQEPYQAKSLPSGRRHFTRSLTMGLE